MSIRCEKNFGRLSNVFAAPVSDGVEGERGVGEVAATGTTAGGMRKWSGVAVEEKEEESKKSVMGTHRGSGVWRGS
jgi:hypothetical protein